MAAGSRRIAAAARAWASSKEIFGQRISDHVPQEFTFAPEGSEGSGIQVLSWNIMARAFCRRKAVEGQDSEISNNGLEMDETIQEYTERLLQKVAPMIISWILQHYRGSRRKWICCLQEVPGHRHLRRDLLQKVQAGLKDKGASLQSAEQATSAFMCTVTLWETAAWDLQHCAHSDHVLCTVLSSKGTGGAPVLLRVMNCHLPLDQGLISSTESTSMARVVQLLAESPAQQVALVVGDLKLDLAVEGAAQTLREAYAKCLADSPEVGGSAPENSLLCAVVPGSSLYDWTRGTLDAAIMAPGLSETEKLPAVPTGSVLKRWDPLNGLSSEEFIAQYINYNLQDRVMRHLPSFTADELGRLGAHHFGDQADELHRLLQVQKPTGNPKEFIEIEVPKEDTSSVKVLGAAPPASSFVVRAATTTQPPPDSRGFATPKDRQDFIQKHIHRKLQSSVAELNDEDLRLLGLLHFSDQPAELQRFLKPRPARGYEKAAAVCGERWQAAPEAEIVQWRAKGDGIEGLAEWLAELGLEEYQEAAALWCKDMGAIWLAEVKENSEELADHLGLRPLERRRLLRSLG